MPLVERLGTILVHQCIGAVLESGTGKPIPSAIILANRAGLPPLAKTTKSGADGAFQLQGLPPGNYVLCAQVASGEYVNSCEWGAVPPEITLKSAQTLTGLVVALETSSIVTIRLRDPRNEMSQTTKDGRHPGLTLGVWGPKGLYYPAHRAGGAQAPTVMHNGVATYSYRIAVPRDTPLKLHVASRDLKLGDADEVPLPDNASQRAFQRSSSDADPQDFTFSLLGLLP